MEKIKMTFKEATVAVFTNFFNFNGRARRKEFWTFVLFYIVIMAGAVALDVTMGLNKYSYSNGPFCIIANLITFLPYLSAIIRRLHDVGHSGKYILWVFVPFIGAIIILYATLKDSEVGSNDYGDSPKYPEIVYEEDYSNEHEEMV